MNKELISVIVPVYNAELYLKNTIETILNQTYASIEVICVDDGSTDNSLHVLESLVEVNSRVKVFGKKKEGVTLARVYGIEHSSGEYIGFVDADDEIDTTMFERLYDNLKTHDADISHCGYDIRSLDGSKKLFYGTGESTRQNSTNGVKSLLSGGFEPTLCNKLYRRKLLMGLINSSVMDYSIMINEDLLMNYYLFKQAAATFFEDVCLYHYLKREDSASTSSISSKYIWDQINVKRIILNDADGTEYVNDAKKAFLLTCIHVYNSIDKSGNEAFLTDKQKIRELIIKHKSSVKLLNRKYKLLSRLLISSPKLYKAIYKHFS